MISCECATKSINTHDDLCAHHKPGYLIYRNIISGDNLTPLDAPEWIKRRLQAEVEHPEQQSALDTKKGEYIEKMRVGLTTAVLALDHLLGPNWFRADPSDIAAVQVCIDGLDAYQMLTTAGISPAPKRVLNFITQRAKLDGYLEDSITDVCGCAELIESGHQLCPFHRQHYFAYRQKADPATMLRVQHWAQKRKNSVSVWATKGGLP